MKKHKQVPTTLFQRTVRPMDIQELDRYRVLKGKLLRAILRGVRYPFSADFNYVVNLQAW